MKPGKGKLTQAHPISVARLIRTPVPHPSLALTLLERGSRHRSHLRNSNHAALGGVGEACHVLTPSTPGLHGHTLIPAGTTVTRPWNTQPEDEPGLPELRDLRCRGSSRAPWLGDGPSLRTTGPWQHSEPPLGIQQGQTHSMKQEMTDTVSTSLLVLPSHSQWRGGGVHPPSLQN